jgi:hypothetical protein
LTPALTRPIQKRDGMSDSLLVGITLIAFAIAGLLIALESGLVRRNDRMGEKPSDKPIELEILDRWGAMDCRRDKRGDARLLRLVSAVALKH